MYAKKVKRKCGVRGCGNKENVFAVSRRRETGNSVIICSDCLKEALALAAPDSGLALEVQKVRKGKKNAKRAQSKANGESEDGEGADGGEGDEGK